MAMFFFLTELTHGVNSPEWRHEIYCDTTIGSTAVLYHDPSVSRRSAIITSGDN